MNEVHKAYSFRLYPTKEQEQQIRRTIGCCRFVFNYFLSRRKEDYERDGTTLNQYACMRELPSLKQQHPWLREVDSTVLQRAVEELDDAFQRFFREKKGYPRFKSKKHPKQSYTSKRNGKEDAKATIRIEGNGIRLPKVGWVKFAKSREVQGRILSATVRLASSGKFFVSVLVDTEIQPLEPKTNAVGIDLGLIDFAVLSTGERIPNPRHLRKLEEKLKRWQRILSRRKPGGKNREKARLKVARLHEKVLPRFLSQHVRYNAAILASMVPFLLPRPPAAPVVHVEHPHGDESHLLPSVSSLVAHLKQFPVLQMAYVYHWYASLSLEQNVAGDPVPSRRRAMMYETQAVSPLDVLHTLH